MKIKKKKMFKGKHLFFANFSTNTGDFFLLGEKISIHSIFNKVVTSSFNKVVSQLISELVTWVDYDRTWVR